MVNHLHRLATASPGGCEQLVFKNLAHPILLRGGTPDVATAINNFIREEYGQFLLEPPPETMIDAGAYIGDTSAYFLTKYPHLRLVALEPDRDNHEIAERNLAAYDDRSRLLNQALGSQGGTVRMSGSHHGAFVSEAGYEVSSTTVPTILDLMGWDRLDLLKMDIEGAEADVLDNTADVWLRRVGRLIVEPHGPEIEVKIGETLRRNGFSVRQYRSLWYCVREDRCQ
jgi:FkbM family methyltransferase